MTRRRGSSRRPFAFLHRLTATFFATFSDGTEFPCTNLEMRDFRNEHFQFQDKVLAYHHQRIYPSLQSDLIVHIFHQLTYQKLDLYGKTITVADREMVEEKSNIFLSEAPVSDVAFLLVGDPFGATTHTDLVVRSKQLGVDVKIVHNASVMNAIGICGLQLYRYRETVSIPFFTDIWRPDSFYEKIQRNRDLGLHTLSLLDIRVKEPLGNLRLGKKEYEPPRFMTINTAIEQLLEVEQKRGQSAYTEDTNCVGFARLGSEDQKIVAGTMRQLLAVDFGAPLHCLVITGDNHPLEEEMLELYKL